MKMIETQRLLLREFVASDIDFISTLFSDSDVMRFSLGIKTRSESEAWLESVQKSYLKNGFGYWALIQKESQVVDGYCGLSVIANVDGRSEIEVGYRLRREAWGKGLATESASAVRDYGFDRLYCNRLVSLIDPKNLRSMRVAEKLGMKIEKKVMMEGYDYPDYLYVVQNCRANQ